MSQKRVFSQQPFLVHSMKSFRVRKEPWDNINNTLVFFEEFFNDDNDVYLEILPDGFATISFEMEPNNTTAIYYGKTEKSKTVFFNKKCIYFTVKIPPNYYPENTIKPISDYQNKVSKINNFTNVFLDFDYNYFSSIDYHKRIEYFQNFISGKLSLKVNSIIDYVINRSIESVVPISIEEISNELNISSRYIRKIFQEKVGVSPKKTIQSIRFQNILSDLIVEDKKMIDAFLESTFYDHPHFNKFFKERMNYSPSDLKNKLTKYRK